MDLTISGVVSIACPGEGYKYDGASAITLPGMNTAGDCVHDAIAKEGGVSIKSITYDASSDSIKVEAKYTVSPRPHHTRSATRAPPFVPPLRRRPAVAGSSSRSRSS